MRTERKTGVGGLAGEMAGDRDGALPPPAGTPQGGGGARPGRPEVPTAEEPAVPDPPPGPEQQALSTADRESLERHLGRLPWATRASLVLRYVADLPYAEIAAALDRPVGTVRSDVHRGLQRLCPSLEVI